MSALALLAAGAAAWITWDAPGPAPATSADARTAHLAPAFAAAAEAIRRQQSPDGYWATPVTRDRRYEDPTTEVNVFTPAVMIDLLDPVGRETGLSAELARAKAYLRRQVEATGLVRYHGNPGPIDPAQRGCELPPDADDTALVWRIAPPSDRRLLAAARRTIERYADGDGLYRTWLADDEAYRCFYERYAGREWNPADVAIEMHVYLFLAAHDRPAAGRLCAALTRRIDEDRIWVWYEVAPLLPVLREVDLHRRGCALQVPAGRVARAVSGQEPYLTQARLLQALLQGGSAAEAARPSPETFIRALDAGAADGFARLAATPPLLYHNDLSAVPPHFHWSAEVGHALWLRLYVETARRFPGALRLPSPPAPTG
jgi:hypothetical protein